MAFTKALYYPTIGISNEGWLKNAMLYWKEIYTIFPQTYSSQSQRFYSTRTEEEFSEAGLLLPLEVHSSMPEIKGLVDDILKYLDTPIGKEVLGINDIHKHKQQRPIREYGLAKLHSDKLPQQRYIQEHELVQIHSDKWPYAILSELRLNSDDGWVSVDKRFGDFYMTLLATRLADTKKVALLTNEFVFDKLASVVKADASLPSAPDDVSRVVDRLKYEYSYRYRSVQPPTLAQGMLAHFVIEQIEIDPSTPVQKILKFRTKYEDEIARFRVKISELTTSITEDLHPEQLRQQIEDIYINEVKPEINCLKKGLKDSLISWGTKNALTIGCLSINSVALLNYLNLATPFTLAADASFFLTLSAIQYNREKAEKLRQNPYSFVLAAKRMFPRKSFVKR